MARVAGAIIDRLSDSRDQGAAAVARDGAQDVRSILAPFVTVQPQLGESRRIAAALEMSLEMKIIHIHPYKNPLLFFGNAFDLSPRNLGKMLVEASLLASDLLDREGFPIV